MANIEDPDEMQRNAVFHQGLHCLLRLKQPSGKAIHHNSENSTCNTFKYMMGNPILIVSICLRKSIRIQRVNLKSYIVYNHYTEQYIQGSHRLANYLNLEAFLEKSLKIKSALKSTGKSLKSLGKSLNSTIFCRT